MIRKLFPFILIFILFFLQISFHSLFGLVYALPDLIPITLAVAAIRWGMGWTALLGFIAGIIADSFATSFIGLNSLAWVISGSAGAAIKNSLYGNRLAVAVILVAILKALHEIIYYLFYLWDSPWEFISRFFLEAPVAIIYSAGLALVLFIITDSLVLE